MIKCIWCVLAGSLMALVVITLSGCDNSIKQTEQGKQNYAFVDCMNTKKVFNKCKNIKDFLEQTKCMSSICGRPNAEWQTGDPKTFKGPVDK